MTIQQQKIIDLKSITVFDNSTIPDGSCIVQKYQPNKSYFSLKKCLKQVIIDFYLWLSTLFVRKIKNNIFEKPKSIVIAAGGNLGGAIISLPLIEAVKKRWPDTHLIVIANTQHGLDILKLSDAPDSFYLAPVVSSLKSFFDINVQKFRKKIEKHSPDIYISNHNFGLDHLLLPLSIPIRIGHVGENIYGDQISWGKMFNIPVTCKRGSNWLDSYSDLAQTFQSNVLSHPQIKNTSKNQENAKAIFLEYNLGNSEKLIAIQAGVWEKHSFKQWPLESLVDVCVKLYEDHGFIPVIFGVLGEEKIVDMLHKVLPKNKVIDFIGKTTPEQAAALINECSACIANDSGLMHLSAAVGTPTVFIHSISELTWVYGDSINNRIVRNNNCTPCFAIDHQLVHKCTKPCLTFIYPETVIEAVLEVI